MISRERLSRYAEDHDIELIFFDPPEYFDKAIVGLVHGYGQEMAVLYDQERVLSAMAKDMGREAAEEWFDFNTLGAYLGDATPRFVLRGPDI